MRREMRHQMRRWGWVGLTMVVGVLACGKREEGERYAGAPEAGVIAQKSVAGGASVPAPAAPQNFANSDASPGIEPSGTPVTLPKESVTSGGDTTNSAPTITPSMIVRTGQASVEVTSIDTATVRIRQIAQQVGGYIANSSMQGGKNQLRSATFELKIPAARFQQAIDGLRPIGTVESVNVTAEDVGEEFVDVNARLTNAKRLEARLLDLLEKRTGKLSDVVEVEQTLARVREEIERYEGRVRYLRTRAAISTLTVTAHEKTPILDESVGENPIVEGFKTAWRNFVAFISGFIAILGILIPLGALAFIAWRIFRKMNRPS